MYFKNILKYFQDALFVNEFNGVNGPVLMSILILSLVLNLIMLMILSIVVRFILHNRRQSPLLRLTQALGIDTNDLVTIDEEQDKPSTPKED